MNFPWWLWLIIVVFILYTLGGIWYTLKRHMIEVFGVRGWTVGFLVWPLMVLAEVAINSMLM